MCLVCGVHRCTLNDMCAHECICVYMHVFVGGVNVSVCVCVCAWIYVSMCVGECICGSGVCHTYTVGGP